MILFRNTDKLRSFVISFIAQQRKCSLRDAEAPRLKPETQGSNKANKVILAIEISFVWIEFEKEKI